MDISSLFSLHGKSALVTGGAQGIGRELALGLAAAGAGVAVADLNLEGARAVASEIRTMGREAVAVRTDVSNRRDVIDMVESIMAEIERIDVLVNCAGTIRQMPAEEMDERGWNEVLQVNLTGTFPCSQTVGKHMIRQGGGSIVNISSICSQVVVKDNLQCSYYASKAGIAMLTKALAVEWAKYNVRVNAIAPGFTMTTSFVRQREQSGDWNLLLESVPMGRFQEQRELVGPVIFLASDASSYVTGHELVSDGGRVCL